MTKLKTVLSTNTRQLAKALADDARLRRELKEFDREALAHELTAAPVATTIPPTYRNAMTERIEELIDRFGLHTLVDVIAGICGEKAEHIATNWQDQKMAKAWTVAASRLDKLTDTLRKTKADRGN